MGARVASLFNVTLLEGEHDTFLLSADDFASEVARAEVLLAFASRPWALLYASLFHPWMRQLRAASTVVANWAERSQSTASWLAAQEERGTAEELLDIVAGEHRDDTKEEFHERESGLRSRRLRLRSITPERPRPAPPSAAPSAKTPAATTGRRLLSVITEIVAMQQMSATIAESLCGFIVMLTR